MLWQGSQPTTFLKCQGQYEKHCHFPAFEEQEERELVINDEQSSTYLMLAASLICESDYSDTKQLLNEELGICM